MNKGTNKKRKSRDLKSYNHFVVVSGFNTGVYDSYSEVLMQTTNYPNAKVHGFMYKTDASKYYNAIKLKKREEEFIERNRRIMYAQTSYSDMPKYNGRPFPFVIEYKDEHYVTTYSDICYNNGYYLGYYSVLYKLNNEWCSYVQIAVGVNNTQLEIVGVLNVLKFLQGNNMLRATIYSNNQIMRNVMEHGWLNEWQALNWKSIGCDLTLSSTWEEIHSINKVITPTFRCNYNPNNDYYLVAKGLGMNKLLKTISGNKKYAEVFQDVLNDNRYVNEHNLYLTIKGGGDND